MKRMFNFGGLTVDKKNNVADGKEGSARDMNLYERKTMEQFTDDFAPYFEQFKVKFLQEYGTSFSEYETYIDNKFNQKYYDLIIECFKENRTVEETLLIYQKQFSSHTHRVHEIRK